FIFLLVARKIVPADTRAGLGPPVFPERLVILDPKSFWVTLSMRYWSRCLCRLRLGLLPNPGRPGLLQGARRALKPSKRLPGSRVFVQYFRAYSNAQLPNMFD